MLRLVRCIYKRQNVQRNLVLFHDSTASIDATVFLKEKITTKPFVPNAPFLYSLKTSENRKGALGTSGLKFLQKSFTISNKWTLRKPHVTNRNSRPEVFCKKVFL